MKTNNSILLSLLFLCVSFCAMAQQEVEMADGMRSSGKIYVVVSIVLVILIGLFVFLFRMDRKIKDLQNKVKPK
ncbi:MAG: CcmD family protein [Flammeovirgaceae bacterium]|nr:CcmD family protein [Flammeovirgaceae bacterium]